MGASASLINGGCETPFEAAGYERHRPEETLLYQLIEAYYPAFVSQLASEGSRLPSHVEQTFEAFLECGCLEHGFLRVRCESCRAETLVAFSCKRRGFCPSCAARRMVDCAALLVDKILPEQPHRQWVLSVPYPLRWLFARSPHVMGRVLRIATRVISSHLIKKAGKAQKSARTGGVTLIQFFGSGLNLNTHFHSLFLDGVYVTAGKRRPHFQRVRAPTVEELTRLLHRISERVAKWLEREGLIERDEETDYLALDRPDEDGLSQLQGHSITYRIAVGPHRGRKVMTLRTLPSIEEVSKSQKQGLLATVSGFSLHAGVAAKAYQREKIERLCRYIARPAVSEERLSLTERGQVRYELKNPYRNGTTHVIFEPLDFISKLAALVPPPRVNLTRYHGVYAPNCKLRSEITREGKKARKPETAVEREPKTEGERRGAMTWAQRLKRVFEIDISVCKQCGGAVKVIASVEDPGVIKKILTHLGEIPRPTRSKELPQSRDPPDEDLFSDT